MIQEFMEFLAKYDVIAMAVGLLIAGKVGSLVKGLIEDLVTPLIFSPLLTKLKVKKLEELSWNGVLYGKVLSTLIDFLITAIIVFVVIKNFNITLK